MESVLLKSRVGPVEIKRTTKIEHERGVTYERVLYKWSFDNDFKCALPRDTWSELEHEWLDRTANLQYKDALIEL